MRKLFLVSVLLFLFKVGKSQTIQTTLTYSINQTANFNKSNPLLIVMHGYGSNENDLFDLAKQVAPNCMIATLRAPIALSADGFCWYNIERLANKQIKYNYNQVQESRNKVILFIRQVCKQYKLDSNNVYLMGFSQGAMMSYELLLQSNFPIKGIMALSGRLIKESSDITNQKNLKQKKVFIAHGISDEMIDISESEKANTLFKTHGTQQLLFKKYPIPHSISNEEVIDIKNWFAQITAH